MTLSNKNSKFLFELNVDGDNPLRICQKYKNTIIDRLLKYQTVVNAQYNKNDRVKIVFLPHRFDIIIKNGTAYFYIKGDN
ncbi:hypothetical protein C3L23_03480 [Nautilia sp. PV-1]|uniref:hypothetical protein n=1 Tax=Nautilia sp. PV-1 TaxID=2579250 RepID=UPI000FDF662B|nr:hypothetical protein [Nautilia sp. PV-1]AZV46365.1 hypothetical protein C3L23_03480 [Nautilia sp. PV-1]